MSFFLLVFCFLLGLHQEVLATWTSQVDLQPDDLERTSYFGRFDSIGVDGDTLAVGAPYAASLHGKIYIFSYDEASQNWSLSTTLEGPNRRSLYGSSLALYQNVLALGVYTDSTHGIYTGAVHLWQRDSLTKTWSHDQTLYPSNPSSSGGLPDKFGYHVHFSTDGKLFVGAEGKDQVESNSGAVYLFETDSDNLYVETAIFAGSSLATNSRSGAAIASSSTYLAVGAPYHLYGEDNVYACGEVTVFSNGGGGDFYEEWTTLGPDSLTPGTLYGKTVAITEDYLFVGAPGDSTHYSRNGAVYIYSIGSDGSFNLFKKLFDPLLGPFSSFGRFGASLAALGHDLVIGAPSRRETSYGSSSGCVFSYTYSPVEDEWNHVFQVLSPEGTTGGDQFGSDLALSSTHLFVGGHGFDSPFGIRGQYGKVCIYQNL